MDLIKVAEEAFATGKKFIVPAFVTDGSVSFQCKNNGVAGSTVRGKTGAFIKSHQHIFHGRVAHHIHVGNAAFFIGNQIL